MNNELMGVKNEVVQLGLASAIEVEDFFKRMDTAALNGMSAAESAAAVKLAVQAQKHDYVFAEIIDNTAVLAVPSFICIKNYSDKVNAYFADNALTVEFAGWQKLTSQESIEDFDGKTLSCSGKPQIIKGHPTPGLLSFTGQGVFTTDKQQIIALPKDKACVTVPQNSFAAMGVRIQNFGREQRPRCARFRGRSEGCRSGRTDERLPCDHQLRRGWMPVGEAPAFPSARRQKPDLRYVCRFRRCQHPAAYRQRKRRCCFY